MSEVFLKLVNMSISASWLVLAVLLLRLVLKKAPKWVHILLWGMVAIRLVCPFSFESVLSLIPSAQTVSPEIMMDWTPEISTGIGSLDTVINPVITESFAPEPYASANPLQILIPVCANLWLLGVAGMLVYAAVSFLLLRRRIATAVRLRDNLYQSEYVDSPFVLGVVRPKVYLPFQIGDQNLAYVIAHEAAHIRRKDHWWKPLGFLLLTLHWFNPLMWLGYLLLCRDIELACDEKVIREMDPQSKADYTQALVACSVNRRRIAACPLAFGEVGVRQRIKSVLHYHKPAFWILAVAIVVCIAVAVCFLTDPRTGVNEQLSVYIDCQIAGHFQTEKSESNACCVNWEVLGTQKRGSVTSVYMWVLYEEYSMRDGELYQETGSHIPTLITVKYEDDTYKLIEYWEPRDGSYFVAGIREKFPWYLQRKALDSQRYIDVQQAENKQMALEYFRSLSDIGGAQKPENVVITNNGGLLSSGEHFSSVSSARLLTHNDVITLSKKGYDLGWSDFEQFVFYETGSGLYIRVYEIDEVFEVWVGGTEAPEENEPPMYIYLTLAADPEQRIDIRDGGVVDFFYKHSTGSIAADPRDVAIKEAILQLHEATVPDGFLATESHIAIASEAVSGTPAAGQSGHVQEERIYLYYLHLLFDISGDRPEEHEGIFQEAIATFSVDEDGTYTLKSFLRPQYSADYDEELFRRFLFANEDVAKNSQKYAERLLSSCWAAATQFLEDLSDTAAQPGGDIPFVPQTYSPIIDTIDYDIDRDGKAEGCTLTYGPTSGLFSVTLYASPVESASEDMCKDTFVLMGAYDLSFVVSEAGTLQIKGEDLNEAGRTVWFDVALKDGHIVLQCEEEGMVF